MGVITAIGLAADSPVGVPLIGYNNIVTAANISTTTATADFPASNLANSATHLKWQGDVNTGDEYITIAGGGSSINYIAIAKHNFNTVNTFLSVEVSDTNSPGTWTPVISPQAVTDTHPIIFRFPAATTQVRVRIQQAQEILPEAAVVYAGTLLVMQRSIKVDVDHVPITYGRRTDVVSGMSETGNFLGRIVIGEYRQSKADFSWFTPEFYRSSIDPFLIAAQSNPFFWAWSPSEYPLETGYAWLTADAEPFVNPVTRRIALTLNMRGIA
jgi:hypothetical protein